MISTVSIRRQRWHNERSFSRFYKGTEIEGDKMIRPIRYSITMTSLLTASVLLLMGCGGVLGDEALSEEAAACAALTGIPNLTLTSAELVPATDSTPQYCYVNNTATSKD
jgi:hypothetical protein